MAHERLTVDFSFSEYIEYIKKIVSMYEIGNEDKYIDIHKDLDVVENRISDEDLYLGVIGSFSSGKSTFINSVIQKNLLPTDAVQGTTVAASILKKADFEDLEIQYSDGSVKRYSESFKELNERYGIASDVRNGSGHKVLLFKRIINWIKRLFHLNVFDDKEGQTDLYANRMELFRNVIATEELASDIKRVTLYYQNANIPYRIALVDTPGTESLNKRHNKVTKCAIDEICDAIVVIIPYDEPVSEELLNYVNNNLEKNKAECIFIVTKVELLGDKDELPRLMRVIKKRLENGLSIESAQVIPMPTLIYLKSVDLEMKMTFLDDIPETEKKEFIVMYENGISQIKEILEENRNNYIKKKIIDICERVSIKLNSNLSAVVDDYDEKNRLLAEESVPPLSNFENQVEKTIKECFKSYKNRVPGEVSLLIVGFSNLQEHIDSVLNGCENSQEIVNQMDFSCKDTLSDIQKTIDAYLKTVGEGFNKKIGELGLVFSDYYMVCGVERNVSLISVNGYDFFSESFWNECEEILHSAIADIKTSIQSDTNGFFKKVKTLFLNPFEKHKEMALSILYKAIDQIKHKVTLYVQNEIESRVGNAADNSEASIRNMIEKNRGLIEGYIERSNQSMVNNTKGKEETQTYIDRLNQYIISMKEVI